MTAAMHLSLVELSQRIAAALGSAPGLTNVWVTAETSDLRVSNGHCYMELLQKDDGGKTIARMRANAWANMWAPICRKFAAATGSVPATGMKILARVTVVFHPSFGFSLNISDIDPSYTIGEAVRRRNEIIMRLQKEGLTQLNRSVKLPIPTQRIAVISARGAAGFGDFINQLFNNDLRLKFDVELFEAVMQGERTVPSVMAALQQIQDRLADFDAVVIIRGGGSTSNLAAFDDYDLAVRIARFPLPVTVGIGHERDITVLDYVAYQRVKTPTAAAEWLINRGKAMLDSLDRAASLIYMAVSERITTHREHLARIGASLPAMVAVNVMRQNARLDTIATAIATAVDKQLTDNKLRLDRLDALVQVLSPEAVLKRGFSMTMGPDGHALRDVNAAVPGTQIKTILANGSINSVIS